VALCAWACNLGAAVRRGRQASDGCVLEETKRTGSWPSEKAKTRRCPPTTRNMPTAGTPRRSSRKLRSSHRQRARGSRPETVQAAPPDQKGRASDGILGEPRLGSHCSDIVWLAFSSAAHSRCSEPRSHSLSGRQSRELGPQPTLRSFFLGHPGGFSRFAPHRYLR